MSKLVRPYISVVVPAHNEERHLGQCLASLLAQAHSKPFEIIVVDNNSNDKTATIAEGHQVKVVKESKQGVCAARQAGLLAAKGEIVISTDADCIYPADWLSRIEEVFSKQSDVALYLGTYRFSSGAFFNRLLSAWQQLAERVYYGFGKSLWISAANLAYRRELFDGYNPKLGAGGDELYVLSQLGAKGRVLFDTHNMVLTSPRRLQRRFATTLLHDFVIKYVASYALFKLRRRHYADPRAFRGQARQRASAVYSVTALGLLLLILAFGVVALVIAWKAVLLIWLSSTATKIAVLALCLGILAWVTFAPSSQAVLPAPYKVRTKQKLVALTFDDGPNDPYTSQIAEVIEKFGGKASFFQCGQSIERFAETTTDLSRRGHTIGNHTYSHRFWRLWNYSGLLGDVAKTNDLIAKATGKRPRFFRSPWLVKNPVVALVVARLGLQPVAGRVLSYYEVFQPNGDAMANKFIKTVQSGTIIIMHDSRETKGG